MKKRAQKTETEKREYLSKIISVFGTKGGTGKTTIAVNMAIAMQKKGMKTALVDLDLQFGDVGVFLDIPRVDTISDLVMEGVLEEENILTYLYKHSSGIQVLCAPNSPELAELIKPDYIDRIINVLKEEFDYLIIDLGPVMDECSLKALDLADIIYFVTNPEIATLKNTKVGLNVLTKLDLIDKVKLVLNKDGDSFIKRKNIEEALGMEMTFTVARDSKGSISAVNRGIPIILANPKSKASKSLMKYIQETEI